MTELTEKWKKGKLEQGWYYVRYKNNIIDIDFAQSYCVGRFANIDVMKVFFEDDYDIEEVLAPVPSYQELQRLESDSLAKNEGVEIVAELKEENARLKGLLKECKEFISERLDRLHGGKKYGLLSMINEVLNEL